MSKYSCFDVKTKDHICSLVLNRPNELNTMTRDFWVELSDALEEINRNSEVRVVILSSTGKHFCAGMDLSAFSNGVDDIPDDKKPDHARVGEVLYRTAKELQGYISKLEEIRVPVIAAVHGGVIGGALDLITACDMRFASKDAFFCIQEINIGMAADVGTLQRLPKIIPDSKMREMAYTGRRMLADEAKDSGLVGEIYETHEELINGAMDLAKDIASNSPLVIKGVKMMLDKGEELTADQSLDLVRMWSTSFLTSEDLKEGVFAMMEKRDPKFKGK